MGTTGAMGMAEAVSDGLATLRQGLLWHLTCNHFPPLPAEWVDAAIAALEAGADEDWEREILLPEAGQYAEQTFTAGDLIEAMHLDAYLWAEDDDHIDNDR